MFLSSPQVSFFSSTSGKVFKIKLRLNKAKRCFLVSKTSWFLDLLPSIFLSFDHLLTLMFREQTEYLGATVPRSRCTRKEPKKLLYQLSAA